MANSRAAQQPAISFTSTKTESKLKVVDSSKLLDFNRNEHAKGISMQSRFTLSLACSIFNINLFIFQPPLYNKQI